MQLLLSGEENGRILEGHLGPVQQHITSHYMALRCIVHGNGRMDGEDNGDATLGDDDDVWNA